jgi:hypothetical protein
MQKIIKGSKPKMYEITKQNSFLKKSEQQLWKCKSIPGPEDQSHKFCRQINSFSQLLQKINLNYSIECDKCHRWGGNNSVGWIIQVRFSHVEVKGTHNPSVYFKYTEVLGASAVE